MRQVRVVTSTRPLKVINTEAQTWGALKDALGSEYGNLNDSNVLVKETKTALVLDESVLPEENFTMIISPKKVKAGNHIVEALEILKEQIIRAFDAAINEIECDEDDDEEDEDDDYDGDDLDDEEKDLLNKPW